MAEISAKKDLAGPSYSGDFPGLGRDAQDFGYFEKTFSPGVTGNTADPPTPIFPSAVSHAGFTARVENLARTIGAQIFGKW